MLSTHLAKTIIAALCYLPHAGGEEGADDTVKHSPGPTVTR